MVRHSVSFPGTTVSVLWLRATPASHAPNGFAATATRCFPSKPTLVQGRRWVVVETARVRRRIEYTWSDFWTTRGRPSFLSPRRATRSQRGPYEVIGSSRSTKPARSLGGSNVTSMNLEARPWLVDFHAAAALKSFRLFWVFLLGLFLAFSDF